MDAKLKNLELILERMNVLYERMLGILGREKTALISFDFDAILVEMREKDEIIAAIRGLDRDRLRIQDQFAIIMGRDAEELSLRALAEALMEQGGSALEGGVRLMELRTKMAGTVAALQERIELNRDFIERSVHNLQGIAATLTANVAGKPKSSKGNAINTYNGKAKYEKAPGQTGTIVEKRF